MTNFCQRREGKNKYIRRQENGAVESHLRLLCRRLTQHITDTKTTPTKNNTTTEMHTINAFTIVLATAAGLASAAW